MESKFKAGDKVKVINYGHLYYSSTEGIKDASPYIVGQKGIVRGSYFDLFPTFCVNDTTDRNKHIYDVDGIPRKCAWYNEDQLELIK